MMRTRALRLRGAVLHLSIPRRWLRDHVLRGRRRGRTGPQTAIEVREPPPVGVRDRSLRGALVSVGFPDPAEPGEGSGGVDDAVAAAWERDVAVDRELDLAGQVAATRWYHTIELPGGAVTPGRYDHRPVVSVVDLPDDLRGRRALDVATFDGFWAFELERRGADVVALDLSDPTGMDLPERAGEVVRQRFAGGRWGRGFEIAHRARDSTVERLEASVYDLDPARHGTFDVVFIGDLLLHLRSPITALERVRSVTRGRLIVADVVSEYPSDPDEQVVWYRGGWNGLIWWTPSVATLMQMINDAGFDTVECRSMYRLYDRAGGGGAWRAVIHAHTATDEPWPATAGTRDYQRTGTS